jgi:FKBP12-rapamycin complex-associated protein
METELVRWKAPNSRLELANTAPRLLSLRDCILVVPGKYGVRVIVKMLTIQGNTTP